MSQTVSQTAPATSFVDVPGARVAYQVRGEGPLLLVVGQPMTSAPFGPVADLLASDHRVVTYDPRGLGESSVDDPSLPVTPEEEADDLAAIIDAVGGGPADVFGSSGGAVAGLALTARHPSKVGTLIAHEPPVCELLEDAPQIRKAVDGIEEAYGAYGSGAAWGGFVSLVMHQGPVPDSGPAPAQWPPAGPDAGADAGADASSGDAESQAPESQVPETQASESQAPAEPVEPQPPSAKQLADDELFFLRMLKPFTRYDVPVAQLQSSGSVVIAIGAASGPEVARRSADALAARLGQESVVFPGDHGGFMADPAGFADAIRKAIG